jgi:hypothetical protein
MMSERARRGRRCKNRGGRKKRGRESWGRGREWFPECSFGWKKKKKKGGRGDGEENARLREMGEENEKIKNNKIILKNNI